MHVYIYVTTVIKELTIWQEVGYLGEELEEEKERRNHVSIVIHVWNSQEIKNLNEKKK